MSNAKPRLSGPAAAAVLIVVALCLTAIQLMALYQGINGTMMSLTVGGLVAIGAGAGGVKLGDILRK